MQPVTESNFGPLIAYLVPGATALWGFSWFTPTLASWFAATPEHAPTISGFLYLTIASITAGMTVSAIRWAVVDHLHAVTGLRSPELDFAMLSERVEAFQLLIEIHYRHYQFYANMFVATAIAFACYRFTLDTPLRPGVVDFAFLLIESIFFLASRDTLRKYYDRSRQLFGARSS